MKNISTGLIIVALAVSALALYLAWSGPSKFSSALKETAVKFDKEIQRLNIRTSPFAYVGSPVGYIVEFENGVKFYIAGDTDVFADMKYEIGDYYKPEVAILPIGNFFTMDPKLAAYATSLINPGKYVIPMHYKSFPMLVKDSNKFFVELKKYGLGDKFLAFEEGEEKDILGVKTVWLSHGSWLFESPKGIRILVDPAVKYSGVWPEAYKDYAVFGKMDMILLTHAHPDHVVTSDLAKFVKLYDPVIFAPWELGSWLTEYVAPAKIFNYLNKGSNIGGEEIAKVGFPVEKMGGVRFYTVPADHSSAAIPQ